MQKEEGMCPVKLLLLALIATRLLIFSHVVDLCFVGYILLFLCFLEMVSWINTESVTDADPNNHVLRAAAGMRLRLQG
jgi:hypothetical protein